MHIQGPRGSRRGGWESLDTGLLSRLQSYAYGTNALKLGARALHRPATVLASSCLAAGVCRETSGETHLISIEVQQDLPCGYRVGVTLGQGRSWYISFVRVHPSLGCVCWIPLCLLDSLGCVGQASVSVHRPLLPSRSPVGDPRSYSRTLATLFLSPQPSTSARDVHVHVKLPSRQDAQPQVPWRPNVGGAESARDEGRPPRSTPDSQLISATTNLIESVQVLQ